MALEGVPDLLKKFEALGGMAQGKVLEAALRSAARPIVKDARARIPVGDKEHRSYDGVLVAPGFAKRSIIARTFIDRRTGRVSVAVGVRARAFYAVQFVERSVGKSKETGRAWLAPAFESTREEQIANFTRAMARRIARILQR